MWKIPEAEPVSKTDREERVMQVEDRVKDKYHTWKNMVEKHLIDTLPETDRRSRRLYEAMTYSLKAGGKRLRPVLLLEACSLCGGSARQALSYACAVEFIHTYSLIHDDHPSMDNDDFRRGKPTNHVVFGDGMAILAGDGLLNSAFDVMLSEICAAVGRGESGESVRNLAEAAAEISEAAGVRGMIAGQATDLLCTGSGSIPKAERDAKMPEGSREELLLYIHRNKTGALIRGAVRAGAMIAGASEEQLQILTEYAENLGLAFQISDDILDVTGDAETLGKNTGADERLGKLTYPSVYGLMTSGKKLERATAAAVTAASRFGEEGEFLAKLAIDLQNRVS